MIVLTAIGMIAWVYFQKTVQSELRSKVQANFDAKLANTNLKIEIGSAHFIEGRGLRLNNVSIRSTSNAGQDGSQLAEIYEAFLHAPISITSLVTCELHPKGIEIRRAKINAKRMSDGTWNLAELVDAANRIKSDTCGPVPLSFADCQIEISDQSNPSLKVNRLSEVTLQLIPVIHEKREILQIGGSFHSSELGQVRCAAYVDPSNKTWIADFQSYHSRISKDLFELLPPSALRSLGPSPSVSALVKFHGSATGRLDLQSIPEFKISGSVSEFSSDDHRLPLPITQASADFALNNNRIELTNVVGRLGNGEFKFDYHQSGLLERNQWSLEGKILNFDFSDNEELASKFPVYCQNFCRDFSPRGRANIYFNLAHDGARLTRKIEGRLTDMSIQFIRFPYRLDHCTGFVTLEGPDCRFEFESLEGQQLIEIKGHAKNPGPDATYQVNLAVPGELPIDDKLLNAMKSNPKLFKIVANFNPTGRIGGLGRIEKRVPRGEVHKSFDIRMKQCNVRHNFFDYPISNIQGLIRTRDNQFDFEEITGTNSSGSITCNGNWNPIGGLDLRFNCQNVPLDEQLKFALRPEIREIWEGFRPRGSVDTLRVDLTMPPNKPQCDVVVEAELTKSDDANANSISIHPTWFPYELKSVTGKLKVGHGSIQLDNIEGRHGRSWMVCQGEGRYSEKDWSVDLSKILVGSLVIDEELLAAMPASLSKSVRQLNYQGLLNLQGEVNFAGAQSTKTPANFSPRGLKARLPSKQQTVARAAPPVSMAWNVRLDMNQARMKIGLPVDNVFGNVKLKGQYDGKHAECQGDLNLDSLTVYGAQITKVRGPIKINNETTSAGTFAQAQAIDPKAGNFSPAGYSKPTPSSITGLLYGGVIKFDAQMSSGPAGEFYIQSTLADGNLKEFCREFAPHLSEVSGRSFAAMRLKGNYHGLHSYQGDGTIQLRDAKIYELPVVLSLLKILSIRQVTRTAFDASNVDFKISGDTIDFDRIELLGDAISLLGNGKMNLDRDIDLNFYSIMGRNQVYIPLISDLYKAGSQQILWINVDGTLDDPQTHRHVLPQFNDTLKQLFEPQDSGQSANNWGRSALPVPQNAGPAQTDESWR